YAHVAEELKKWTGPAIDDMVKQMEFLLPRHAVTIHGIEHLRHLPRYLQPMRIRLDEMGNDPDNDADRQAEIDNAKAYLDNQLRNLPAGRATSRAAAATSCRIQEHRSALFEQRQEAAHAVSLRRIQKAVDKL